MVFKEFIRNDWVSACRFHPLDEKQVLGEVFKKAFQPAGRRPVVLLDLDSTLYEVRTRTFQILKEWRDTDFVQEHSVFKNALGRLEEDHIGYSLKDTFSALDIDVSSVWGSKILSESKKFWAERFFSSEYLKFDHPYDGSVEFCQNLYRQGVEMVYLTGRDEKNMGEGSRANLLRDGFPWGTSRTHLLLKKSSEIPDIQHKKTAAEWVNEQGSLVASFENEPANLVALYEKFPHSMHVFVDTICSDHPAEPREGLYRIRSWQTPE